MLRVTLLAVGGLKERYWADACSEYRKRLAAYCRPEVIEVAESRLPRDPSPAQVQKCVETEGAAILARLPPRCYTFALCVEGRQMSSQALAGELRCLSGESSRAVFVIGGSHGLSEEVKRVADWRLSMSEMTFPHQLARVMLLEQLYRAFSISAGGKYHK